MDGGWRGESSTMLSETHTPVLPSSFSKLPWDFLLLGVQNGLRMEICYFYWTKMSKVLSGLYIMLCFSVRKFVDFIGRR